VKPRFEQGDTVIIERGALAAVDAIFDRELDSASRVQILVNMMGRSLPVRIDVDDLSKAAS
jgi:transcription antitermination factor NusG